MGYGLLAAACMAGLDAAGKGAAIEAPIAQVIALRAACVLALAWPMIGTAGARAALATRRWGAHGVRVLAILISMAGFFVGVREMPLANATAIGLSAPLFMTALAWPILGEAVDTRRALAVVVGFAGVLFAMGSGYGAAGWWPMAMMVLSAAFFGFSLIMTRKIAASEGDAALLLFTNLGVMIGALLVAPFEQGAMSWTAAGLATIMAVLMLVGQVATYRGLRAAPIAVLAPIQYSELVFAAALGWLIWREDVTAATWVGGGAIVLGALLAIRR